LGNVGRLRNTEKLRPFVALIFLPGYLLAVALAILMYVPFYLHLRGLEQRELLTEVLYLVPAGICTAVTLFLVIRSFRGPTIQSHSILLKHEDAPRLYHAINRICEWVGAVQPNNVVLEFSSSFYVTEARVINFKYVLKKRTLCISAPLLHVLTPEELLAIVAHEMAHFSGKDTLYGKIYYPVYRGLEESLRKYAEIYSKTRSISDALVFVNLAIAIPTIVLGLFLSLFKWIERGMGRQRELRADRIAVDLTEPEVMGAALIKLNVAAIVWSRTYAQWERTIATRALDDIYLTDFRMALPESKIAMLDLLSTNMNPAETHPFDSHPSLDTRLANLGLNYAEGILRYGYHGLDLNMSPETSATVLLADAGRMTSELTQMEREWIKRKHGV
jgi:Zn-dependent protease with chaperone function